MIARLRKMVQQAAQRPGGGHVLTGETVVLATPPATPRKACNCKLRLRS